MIAIVILVAGNMEEWYFLFDFVLRFIVNSGNMSQKRRKEKSQNGSITAKSEN